MSEEDFFILLQDPAALPLYCITKMKMAENNLILHKYRKAFRCMAFPCLDHISWHLVTCLSLATAACLGSKMTKIKIFPSGYARLGHMDTLIGSAYYGADSVNLYH